MTDYEDEEVSDHELFGLKFRATLREQRALWLKLSMSQESREWGQCRNLFQMLSGPTVTTDIGNTALKMEAADQAMTRLAAHLIDELEAARARE